MTADGNEPDGSARAWNRGLGRALAAGVAVGLLAMAVAWLFIPVQSAALLRLRFPDQQWMDQQATSQFQSWLSSRRGQADSITDEAVLGAIFHQPEILKLPGVAEANDPAIWLHERLRAGFVGDSAVLQVVVAGETQDEVSVLARAIKTAYLETFLAAQREKRLQHKKTLGERRQGNRERIPEQTAPVDQPKTNTESAGQLEQQPDQAKSKLADRVESLRAEVDKLSQTIDQCKAQLREADREGLPSDGTHEQTAIERYLSEALADDPALARDASLSVALGAALYEERSRAVRPDQPSVARLEDRLMGVRGRAVRRREELRPEMLDRLERQIAEGRVLLSPAALTMRIEQHEQQKAMLGEELRLATSMLKGGQASGNSAREQASGRSKVDRLKADTSEVDGKLAHLDTELAALDRILRWNRDETPSLSSNVKDRHVQIALAGLIALLATAALVLQRTRD